MGINLFELARDIRRAESELDTLMELGHTEPVDDLMVFLDSLALTGENRAEQLVLWTKELDAHVVACEAEIQRLQARAKTISNRSESVKAYVMNYMELLGLKSFKTHRISVSMSPGKDKIEFAENVNHKHWPEELQEVAVRVKYDYLKTPFQNMADEQLALCPGVRRVKGKPHLRVK